MSQSNVFHLILTPGQSHLSDAADSRALIATFLAFVEREDKIKLNVTISRALMDELATGRDLKLLERLKIAHQSKRMTILTGFVYDIPISELSDNELEIALGLDYEPWRAGERSGGKFFYLSNKQVAASSLKALSAAGAEGVMVDANSLAALSLPSSPFSITGTALRVYPAHVISNNDELGMALRPDQPQSPNSFFELSFSHAEALEDFFSFLRKFSALGTTFLSDLAADSLESVEVSRFPTIAEKAQPDQWPGFKHRIDDLRRLTGMFDLHAQDLTPQSQKLKRFFETARFYFKALALLEKFRTKQDNSFHDRCEFFEVVTRAQVEIDDVIRPNVDPLEGWVTHDIVDYNHDNNAELIVDTQLMRLYFDPNGAGRIDELDFKPWKLNLLDTVSPTGANQLILTSDSALSLEMHESESPWTHKENIRNSQFRVLRSTRDTLGVRFASEIFYANGHGKFSQDMLFRSGIGAHLNNATTGYSTEYYFESQTIVREMLLGLGWNVYFRTGEPHLESFQPLLSVGGVSESRSTLVKPVLLRPNDVPGGIYGVRLQEGVTEGLIDFRSAKPLAAIAVIPILRSKTPVREGYQGLRIVLYIEAKRILSDENTNTVFVSIL